MSTDNQIKRIIIVGATSGIGRKMAELYAQKGNIVGITGRRKELLDEIEKMFPGQIKTECFDVTGNENIKDLLPCSKNWWAGYSYLFIPESVN